MYLPSTTSGANIESALSSSMEEAAAVSLGRSALHNFSPVVESCTLNRLPRRTTMDDLAIATANDGDDPPVTAEPTLIFLASVASPPADNSYWYRRHFPPPPSPSSSGKSTSAYSWFPNVAMSHNTSFPAPSTLDLRFFFFVLEEEAMSRTSIVAARTPRSRSHTIMEDDERRIPHKNPGEFPPPFVAKTSLASRPFPSPTAPSSSDDGAGTRNVNLSEPSETLPS
mmetsp:Transcript_38017/g.91697  ORF Transcript_38017/g.91697 Transcript_38017/m.91697 type:complete len:226 (+) Transcript_38017:507-1184(+)